MLGMVLMNNQTRVAEVNSFGDWLRQQRKALDCDARFRIAKVGMTGDSSNSNSRRQVPVHI